MYAIQTSELDDSELETIKDRLVFIKDWLKDNPHIKFHTDDKFILSFLKSCEFDMEKTKNAIRNYYHPHKSNVPELFMNRDPFIENVQHVLTLGTILVLKNSSLNGPVYLLERIGLHDTKKVSVWDKYKINFMIADILIKENRISNGIVFIVDARFLTFSHCLQYSPSFLWKCLAVAQHAIPIKLTVHIINAPTRFGVLLSLCKSFLSEKWKNIFYVYGMNYEKVYEYVPRHLFPTEYGGDAGPVDVVTEECKAIIESNSAWFQEDEKLCFPKK